MSDAIGLVQIIEASLLAAGKPMSVSQLGALFEDHERPSNTDIREALNEVKERCEGRGYELAEVASGFRFQVREQLSPWVGRLWQERPARYSRALLETLALVAYRQPITRGEIEEIRGVAVSTNIIRTLHERDWIRVVGHRDVPGRPAMYATTRQFLDYFNLKSLDQLPALADIRDLETLNAELGFGEPLPDTGAEDSSESQGVEGGAEDTVASLDTDTDTDTGTDSDAKADAEASAEAEASEAMESSESEAPSDDHYEPSADADEAPDTMDGSEEGVVVEAAETADTAEEAIEPVDTAADDAGLPADEEGLAEHTDNTSTSPAPEADPDIDDSEDSLTERSVNGQG